MQESKCKSQDKLKFGFFIKFYVRRYCSGGAKDIFVDKKKKKQISLPACVTDHMPIHLHLDLPTTPTPTLKPTSQSSPPRTLYHSKRLKDKDTKEAFTRALAKKVLRITPTIQKLYTQLQGKKISPQLFADTANSEITSVLQKTALDILTQVDPSQHTRTTANPHVTPSNHHSSKDPHEALLQRTIQLHRNPLPKFDNTGNLLYYLISSRICAIFRVLLMFRNFRLASTPPLLALSMSMEIIQPY